METIKHTLSSGRTVTILEGCGRGPMHFPWLGCISPDFGVVIGGSEGDANEELADAIKYPGLDDDYIDQLVREILQDEPDLSEESAWAQATEGMLALNGGAEWIDNDDWGFWSPSQDELWEIKRLVDAVKALDDAEWVCQDCVMAIANGDLPEDPEEIDRPWLRLDEIPSTWVALLDPTESGLDHQEFSWHQCDCCGSRLGGSRHAAVRMDRP